MLGKNEDVAVPLATNVELLQLVQMLGMNRIFVEVKNTGANAFDAFRVSARPHPDADYVPLAIAAGDFTTPVGAMVGASGDLTTLAAGATGWFFMDLQGIEGLKVEASAGVGATVASIYAQAANL